MVDGTAGSKVNSDQMTEDRQNIASRVWKNGKRRLGLHPSLLLQHQGILAKDVWSSA